MEFNENFTLFLHLFHIQFHSLFEMFSDFLPQIRRVKRENASNKNRLETCWFHHGIFITHSECRRLLLAIRRKLPCFTSWWVHENYELLHSAHGKRELNELKLRIWIHSSNLLFNYSNGSFIRFSAQMLFEKKNSFRSKDSKEFDSILHSSPEKWMNFLTFPYFRLSSFN